MSGSETRAGRDAPPVSHTAPSVGDRVPSSGPNVTFGGDGRGQAHTLEGIIASLVLLTAVIFALEMTAVTPLSASTSSQHLENQQEATARGILASAAETGALKDSVLFWNTTAEEFYESSDRGYYAADPPTEFGAMLDRSFSSQGIAYNVYLTYEAASGDQTERRMVYQGRPSDNAVRASWTVALFDNDHIVTPPSDPPGPELSATSDFYAPNAGSSSVYNVVRVEVVVWRI